MSCMFKKRKLLATLAAAVSAGVAVCLFVPRVRDKVFTTSLWPWSLPWDTSDKELALLKELSEPGDVLLESNLHGWQWIALAFIGTGTTWVHAALVDRSKSLLTVHKEAIEADWSLYREWRSTRLALIRPPYRDDSQREAAINFARQRLGTPYDPSFQTQSGHCNGLVAEALKFSGIAVTPRKCWGRELYAPDCFLEIPAARLVWTTDRDRRKISSD